MEKITKGDLVVIWWYDAVEESAWQAIYKIEKEQPPISKTVGWYLSEDKICIRILFSISSESLDKNMEASYSVIPKGMIIKIEKIKEDEIDCELEIS